MKVIAQVYEGSIDDQAIADLHEASQKLLTASNSDFERLQSEPWYKRLMAKLTFQDIQGQYTAAQINTLTQAQIFVIKLLTGFSGRISEVFDLMQSQSSKIDRLAASSVEIAESILDHKERLSELEQLWYFDIRSTSEIGSLPENEQRTFMALIEEVARITANKDMITQEQQKFHSQLNKTVGRGLLHEASDPHKAYSTIKNTDHREIIITHCLIYTALGDATAGQKCKDFLYSLGGFNINEIETIEKRVAKILETRGPQTFFEEPDMLPEQAVAIEISVEALLPSDMPSDNASGGFFDEDLHREQLTIENNILVAEKDVLTYENKEIRIKANIVCAGSIIFRNCIINYGFEDDGTIYLGENACLTIQQSKIDMHQRTSHFLIKENQDQGCLKIEISGSYLLSCLKFIEPSAKEVSIDGCLIESPGIFIKKSARLHISNSKICDVRGEPFLMHGDETTLENCLILDIFDDEEPSYWGSDTIGGAFGNEVTLKNCLLKNWHAALSGMHAKTVEDCEFYSCSKMFSATLRPVNVHSSNFYDCSNIITHSAYGESKLLDCSFSSCTHVFEGTGLIMDLCSFDTIGETTPNSIFHFTHDSYGNSNKVSRCTFTTKRPFPVVLFSAKHDSILIDSRLEIKIEDCTFINFRGQSDAISGDAVEIKFFSENRYDPAHLTGCRFISRDLETSPRKRRKTSAAGQLIGVTDDNAFIRSAALEIEQQLSRLPS